MRMLVRAAALAAAVSLTGCPNPNAIGVQVYGTVAAHATLASNGQPVSGAQVVVNATQYCITAADGTCQVPQVPIGAWFVKAYAPGLYGCAPNVSVTENTTTDVDIHMGPNPCA